MIADVAAWFSHSSGTVGELPLTGGIASAHPCVREALPGASDHVILSVRFDGRSAVSTGGSSVAAVPAVAQCVGRVSVHRARGAAIPGRTIHGGAAPPRLSARGDPRHYSRRSEPAVRLRKKSPRRSYDRSGARTLVDRSSVLDGAHSARGSSGTT